MDSLLATYASSDDEEDQQQQPPPPKQNQSSFPSQPTSQFGGNFSKSLPPPKLESSNPNSQTLTTTNTSSSKSNKVSHPQTRSDASSSTKSLFSKLPQPKSETSDPFSLNPKPKKVVQFRPPVMSKVVDDDDEDEDDKIQVKKDDFIPQAPSVKSFLSSIPAPRNSGSLGALPSSAGTGRRSILEAEAPTLSNSIGGKDTVHKPSDNQVKYDSNSNVNYGEYVNTNVAETNTDYASYDYSNTVRYQNIDTDNSTYGPAVPSSDDHLNYGGYEGYNDYSNYGQYESKWVDRSGVNLDPEISVAAAIQNVARVPGKRGRNEIPQEIIEVSQDELMKNRPREDQVKATGIAFGPAYQATSSGKGKPTKLHKRKHQIGSLYFDMKSNEMELAERRSRGFLTKAETHAKYGW